jgi:hypothetical protein
MSDMVFKDAECDNYIITEVTERKLKLESECGGDERWVKNCFHYSDTAIGKIMIKYPFYKN